MMLTLRKFLTPSVIPDILLMFLDWFKRVD